MNFANPPRLFVIGLYVVWVLSSAGTGAAAFDAGHDLEAVALLALAGAPLLGMAREFRHASCELVIGYDDDHHPRCAALPEHVEADHAEVKS
ncbi:hypothetical protein [Embleya sp. NPDC001921]